MEGNEMRVFCDSNLGTDDGVTAKEALEFYKSRDASEEL